MSLKDDTRKALSLIEPAILARDENPDGALRAIDRIALNLKGVFGAVIVYPQDYFYCFTQGLKFGIVVNYPTGGGIVFRELQVLWDIPEPDVIDLCMRTPTPEFVKPGEAKRAVLDVGKLLIDMKIPAAKTRLLYDTKFVDTETLHSICEAAQRFGLWGIKTSTGVYTKTTPADTDRVCRVASVYGLKVKAAGGISTLVDVLAHIHAGAAAVGTSKWNNIYMEYQAIPSDQK